MLRYQQFRLDPAALGGGEEGADEDDDAVPDLVENFEAVSTEVSDATAWKWLAWLVGWESKVSAI